MKDKALEKALSEVAVLTAVYGSSAVKIATRKRWNPVRLFRGDIKISVYTPKQMYKRPKRFWEFWKP